MIDEQKLREKLESLWKRHPPLTPSSFSEADALIEEVIEASTVTIKGKVKGALKKKVTGSCRFDVGLS